MRPWAIVAALLASLLIAPATQASQPRSPAKTRYAQVRAACQAPTARRASCFALVRVPVAASSAARAGALPYTVNDGASSSGPGGGLTPRQIVTAYGFDPSVGGAGQTVAIVDAFDDPKIEADLATFDSNYGLPACTEANGCFEKVGQTGSTSALPAEDTSGWSVEIALDVETAHSVCQKCKILLVEANETTYEDLAAAVNEAVAKGATEVSNSYGGPEAGLKASERAAYTHPGVVIAASTGDDGYYSWDRADEFLEIGGELYFGFSPQEPNVPASLPSVVAVGGTTLELTSEDKRASETVWNNNGPGDSVGLEFGPQGATGGGCSKLFAAQPWQRDVSNFAEAGCGSKRLGADVAADANPNTGFDVYDSYDCGSYCEETGLGKGWLTIGGTSLSSPLVTSLYGLAGGSSGLEYPSLTLYGHLGEASALFDVTHGANGYCGGKSVAACGDPNEFVGETVDCEGTTACNAHSGFDGPSGVGTPNGLAAFKPALPSAVISPPGSLLSGVSASFNGGGSSDPYPGGTISSYEWNWGDGTATSSGISPKHTFAVAGKFVVTLTVTDSYGLASQASTKSVTVEDKALKEKEEEEAKKKAEEEAKKKAEEEAKKKAEEEAKKKGEEEAVATRKREEEQLHAGLGNQGVGGFKAAGAATPDARLASTSLHSSSSGFVTVEVSCPPGESTCVGTVTLRTQGAVVAGASTKKSVLSLATGSFDVPGGQVKTVRLRLSRKARSLLARAHVLKVRVTILAHDPAGATHTTQVAATLSAVKARRGRH